MQTTAVIFEILVTGFFALVWISLFILKALGISLGQIECFLNYYKEYSAAFVLIGVIICYQLGWLVNSITDLIIDKPLGEKIRVKIFKSEKKYFSVRALFYQHASVCLTDEQKLHRTVIRLSKGGMFNFTLIFFTLLFYSCWIISCVFLTLAGLSYIQYRDRNIKQYKHMKTIYETILKH